KLSRHVCAVLHQERKPCAKNNAKDTTDGTKRDGFDQKLKQDVAAFCSDGFAYANFACTLRDADEHDVHDTDAANQQADGGNAEHEQEDQEANLVPEIEKIVGSEDSKVVGLVIGKAAFAPKQISHLLNGLRNLRRVAGFCENHIIFLIRIKLAQRGHRHEGNIVFGICAAGNSLP